MSWLKCGGGDHINPVIVYNHGIHTATSSAVTYTYEYTFSPNKKYVAMAYGDIWDTSMNPIWTGDTGTKEILFNGRVDNMNLGQYTVFVKNSSDTLTVKFIRKKTQGVWTVVYGMIVYELNG